MQTSKQAAGAWLVLAGALAANGLGATDAVNPLDRPAFAAVTVAAGGGGAAASDKDTVVISAIEPTSGDDHVPSKGRSWLGVSIEEGSEALASQLGLALGAGLVVTYVTPDSPAAKAGLKKNDVLVELAGHALSHPAQFRRLVQARQGGDTVKLVFYRSGKQQTATATLEKAPAQYGLLGDTTGIRDSMRGLQREFREQHLGEAIREYSKSLQESLGQLSAEYGPKIQIEIERSIEQARKSLQEATRQMSNAQPKIQIEIEHSIEQARKALQEATRQISNSQHSIIRTSAHC